MVRTGNAVNNAMYRSVPPRPYSYTFSDILQSSLLQQQQTRTPGLKKRTSRSKTAPVSSNTPEEYAERFKSRPTARPAVIDLGCAAGDGVKMYAGSGAVCRFNQPGFPAVRTSRPGHQQHPLLIAAATDPRSTMSETLNQAPLTERGTVSTPSLHLAPLGRHPPAAPPDPSHSDPVSLGAPVHPPRGKGHAFTATTTNSNTRPHTPTDLPPPQPHPHSPRHRHHHPLGGLRSSASSSNRSHVAKSPAGSSRPFYGVGGGGGGDPQGKTSGSSSSQHPLTTTTTTLTTATSPTPGVSDSQWQELSSSKLSTLDTQTFAADHHHHHPQALGGEYPGYAQALAHSENYDDLSELPKPKRIQPRRDLPWVFRFKVKKELNALSKIMASKPATGSGVMAAVGPTA
ncbi:uncharacterized protein LOC143291935 [Babylonia areolata]|uniref:uncharacterized protein LOC143291935 n=1 Tax=Babylonia areolata TaxID=304850 RepID=UPI003FD0D1EB